MGLVFDPVSYAVDEFVTRRGEFILNTAFQTALGLSDRSELAGLETIKRTGKSPSLTLDAIQSFVIDICSRNSLERLLLLFRKVRHDMVVSLLRRQNPISAQDIGTLIEQATLYGTNAILQYARRNDELADFGARYRLQPNDEEMSDVLRLVVYAIVHRHAMFFENTQARRLLGHEVSFDSLIVSYNARQDRRHSQKLVKSTGNGRILVIPAFIFNIPLPNRTIRLELSTGEWRDIAHRNYVPVVVDFDNAIGGYDYLETDDVFTYLWGIDYSKWRRLWAALNIVLSESLISLWPPEIAKRVQGEEATAAAERADDYSDTGIGIATVESLIEACMYVANNRFSGSACTREDASLFIDGLSMKGPLDEVHFVEQPILFYEVGHGRVMWDYLRHGGIVRALARETKNHYARLKAPDTSGPGFEKYVAERLRNEIPDIRDLKPNVIIRDTGRKVLEIDLGFVLGEILFLIEAKYKLKNIKYHAADSSEVSDRVQSLEDWCEDRDMKLRTYREHVRQKWNGSTTRGAITIVCTEEAEFVASADRKYWLNFPNTPRICTIDELIEFLNSGGAKSVIDHPTFQSFVPER